MELWILSAADCWLALEHNLVNFFEDINRFSPIFIFKSGKVVGTRFSSSTVVQGAAQSDKNVDPSKLLFGEENR